MSLTITANLKSLTGSADVGSCTFTLVGYGHDVPRISGSIISVLGLTSVASGGGAISQVVIANDLITPASTYYVVSFFSDSGAFISSAKYSLTGTGTIDLSAVSPL